jgi:hypothetical protein
VTRIGEWLRKAEAKLDEYGTGAWIAAMVLGFILIWPLGLFILGYMLWSGRMGCGKHRWGRHRARHAGETGNTAFDEYRESTLKRLEEEREAFAEFLGKLRAAKDKAEFDQFMADRRRRDNEPDVQPA